MNFNEVDICKKKKKKIRFKKKMIDFREQTRGDYTFLEGPTKKQRNFQKGLRKYLLELKRKINVNQKRIVSLCDSV